MIFLREGYSESYVKSSMSIAGIFCDSNMDASELSLGSYHVTSRRRIAEKIERGGESYYRYNIITCINHGLARQEKPLPSSIPIQLTFTRASAKKGLLQISDKKADNTEFSYTDKVVTLINPTLCCYFVESQKADQFYGKTKLYDVGLNFLDYSLRRELLMDNVADFNLKLYEGPLPSIVIMGLIKPSVFDGDFASSALKFQRHNLESFEMLVDSQPVVNHPLKMKQNNAVEFFSNYLRNTNRFYNTYSNGSLSFEDFTDSNFLVFTNLKADNYTHGQLTLKMKFASVLEEKLFCIFIPIYEKQLVFDSYFNVQIQH